LVPLFIFVLEEARCSTPSWDIDIFNYPFPKIKTQKIFLNL